MSSSANGAPRARPELWGGLECTVARIGDRWRDQFRETGHSDRESDLAAIAALGIRTLRYPVLWESIAPDRPDEADWSWHDRRLRVLRDLGITPIVGLVHHGAGPRYTSLVDPQFPEKLAVHAGRVAERYPWLEMFTPVNEPLTTARFAGLYGHWHPHGRDYRTFLAALVNECRGVQSAMQAIRQHIPGARLVQTEDLGRVYSAPELAYQADYENERRWLSFDLLCGRIGSDSNWRPELRENGVSDAALDQLAAAPCPPDVIGINHYLTSDRYLDPDLDAYPPQIHGGNAWTRYADVEAVRVDIPDSIGPEARLREAWERYHIPLAITELHLGCTREEQLRWLSMTWNAARRLAGEGVDMRAVTLWSMLGAVDWNSLLTRDEGHYEPGIFDARFCPIRPTALAGAARQIVETGDFDHPVLDGRGWWERPNRFLRAKAAAAPDISPGARRLMIVAFAPATRDRIAAACHMRGLAMVTCSLEEALGNLRSGESPPWAVLADDRFWRGDASAGHAHELAAACRRKGLACVAVSELETADPSTLADVLDGVVDIAAGAGTGA